MKKRITTLALALVLCVGLAVPAYAAGQTFSDVPATYWAYDEIERAYNDGVMYGKTHDTATGVRTFVPEETLTLAQYIVTMTRAFYSADLASIVDGYGEPTHWYGTALTVSNMYGLFDGFGVQQLQNHMGDPVTRYQMAAYMSNVMRHKQYDMPMSAELAAAQARIGDWDSIPAQYQDAVATVFALGLIGGTDSNGTFAGEGTVKRSTMAVIYARMADALDGSGTTTTPDPNSTTETDVPEPETPIASDKTLANGAPITEENVMALLDELREKYPDGATYDPDKGYYSNAFRLTGKDCAMLAFMISDEIWGDLPAHKSTDMATLRVGDVLQTSNHWCVIISEPVKDESGDGWYVKSVDGGPTGKVAWMDEWSNQYIANGRDYVVWSRYPD